METHNTSTPDLERRYVALTLRADGDEAQPVIKGDAAIFGVETVIGKWFREKIRTGAFTRVLSEKPDVTGAFNHDWSYVLGRTTAGTLKLQQNDKSLRYAIDVNPNDSQAMSVWEKVKRGDVSQSSFAFTVRKEEWTEPADDSDEKLALREIVAIGKLFVVGPVPFAQYPEASAQARSISETFQQAPPAQAASDDAEEVQTPATERAAVRLCQKSVQSVTKSTPVMFRNCSRSGSFIMVIAALVPSSSSSSFENIPMACPGSKIVKIPACVHSRTLRIMPSQNQEQRSQNRMQYFHESALRKYSLLQDERW